MSAYIANPETFGLLAAYALKAGLVHDAADAAELLARENIRSVACRYPDDGQRPGPGLRDEDVVKAARLWAAHYVAGDRDPLSAVIWNACDHVDYQSCHTDAWETTPACLLLEQIKAFIGQKPLGDAPWCYSDPDAPAEVEALYA